MKDYFKKSKFEPDITHGVCPTCDMPTMLVSLTKDHYRCITCGSDLEQKINGVIKYIPVAQLKEESPEVILLSSEPFPFKEKHIEAFQKQLPNTQIKLVDGEIYSWYGSRLVYSLKQILNGRRKTK